MKRLMRMGIPVRVLLMLGILALGFSACSDMGTDQPVTAEQQQEILMLGKDNPGLKRAMEVQERFTSALMERDDVIGTATGVTEDGVPAVIVLKQHGKSSNMPAILEGIPVTQMVVGEVVAYQYVPNAAGGIKGKPGGGGTSIDPKSRFTRPVPIGVSTGNINECASGTIGCRVTDGTNVYVLSNNHVFARENAAVTGENIVQPGRYDVSCAVYTTDIYATLSAYKPIVFTTTASNDMDAAIALTTTADAGNATPANGYGIPNSVTVSPAVNMSVQKYGRTTGLTSGYISAINATITVGYSYGNARYTGQIVISPAKRNKPFSAAGDSGSLIVTKDANANPVGLLFAGSTLTTIANPIDPVLSYFNVTIDGK